MSKDKGFWHEKGQKDRSNEKYSAPSILDDVIMQSDDEDHKAYEKGWKETDQQKKNGKQ